MNSVCVHGYVSGRVQGVWFRSFVQRQTRKQGGVTGWAKNLSDGRVEVYLCGEEDAVERVISRLHNGPRMSRVDRVDIGPVEFSETEGFRIL